MLGILMKFISGTSVKLRKKNFLEVNQNYNEAISIRISQENVPKCQSCNCLMSTNVPTHTTPFQEIPA